MPRIDDPVLPTDFAVKLCTQHKIIPEKLGGARNQLQINEVTAMIADFQRMAVCVPFEDALITFTGEKLSDKQKEILKIIHASTKAFIMGLTIDACLQAITHRTLSRSEFAEALKVITELSTVAKPEESGRMKGIFVKVNPSAKS